MSDVRHHRRRPQRSGGGVLSREGRDEAARARARDAGRRRRDHQRDSSRVSLSRRSRTRCCSTSRSSAEMDLRRHGLELLWRRRATSARCHRTALRSCSERRRTNRRRPAARGVHRTRTRFRRSGTTSIAPRRCWRRRSGRRRRRTSTARAPATSGSLLKTGRDFRPLGTRDAHRLLRWLPMPVADLAREWFEDDLLRATIAAPASRARCSARDRRAARSCCCCAKPTGTWRAAAPAGARRPRRLTQAMAAAATAAGAEIRTARASSGSSSATSASPASLSAGRRSPATTVLSSVDPKTTFLELIDPVDLTPDFLLKMRNYRAPGTVAKVNLALSALPVVRRRHRTSMLTGRIHIGPDLDYLERAFDHAKYGEVSDAAVARHHDPLDARSPTSRPLART